MNTNRDHWQNVFAAKSEDRVTWYQESPEPSLGLILKYFGEKPANGGVIDVGAGASRLVDHLLLAGFDEITLFDISAVALETTTKRLAGLSDRVKIIVGDITRWNPPRRWHLWHDRAVFHFMTSNADQDAYLDAMEQATLPGSIVIIGTFAPDGPEKCSGLPVCRYSGNSLSDRLGSKFELLQSLPHTHITPARNEQKFSFSVFRKSQ